MMDRADEGLEKKNRRFTKGGQNIILLGLTAIMIAVVTTSVSLAIYHNSGDIYLDRSRPGFLPDEAEIEGGDEGEEEYEFSKTGKINAEVLEEYLKNLGVEIEEIDAYEAPFSSEALSDERLGIEP